MRTYSYKIRHSEKYQEWIETTFSQLCYIYNLTKQTKEDSYKAGLKLSGFDLAKQFTQCKKEEGFEWLNEAPAQTQQAVIERVELTFKSFYKGGGYPKWSKRREWRDVPFKQVKQLHNGFFRLPKIGTVKVFNPKQIKGSLKTARIIKEADGYYLQVVVDTVEPVKEVKNNMVAIDRGLKYFAVTSDGEYTENPKINQGTENRLRVLNRKLSRTKKGSNNRKAVVNSLQRLHLKRKRKRTDFLHKLTTKLAKEFDNIVLEDLKVSEMVLDKNFSKAISDVGWYKFEELLSYKTNVIKVNPGYTSQTCSSCGQVDKESRKTQAEFKCTSCGFEVNADYNACQEILKRGRADLLNVKVEH